MLQKSYLKEKNVKINHQCQAQFQVKSLIKLISKSQKVI